MIIQMGKECASVNLQSINTGGFADWCEEFAILILSRSLLHSPPCILALALLQM